jgi:hypothetical protein
MRKLQNSSFAITSAEKAYFAGFRRKTARACAKLAGFCNRLMVQKFKGAKRGAYTKRTYGNKTDVLCKAFVGNRDMAKKAILNR